MWGAIFVHCGIFAAVSVFGLASVTHSIYAIIILIVFKISNKYIAWFYIKYDNKDHLA